MGRDKYPRQSLGALYTRIKQSRILMVGAGGIGCELLKNLVLTGFGEIHIVDLDTIDLSNLNRQFLFRHEHIKKSKALVAKESAGKFNPNVNIVAHHANIKDLQFNVDWFKGFSLVFNALDNLDARRHVNKMCLAADVPLIESGTTGFNGQVQVIKKGLTECYDCNVKETPKSFPVCTVRSTPSQPIHCIVWAKSYLFTELFGISEDEVVGLDHSEDAGNKEEIENLRREAQELKKIRESMGSKDFPRLVFDKVFKKDILRLRSMEDMWKHRRPPEPLDWDAVSQQALDVSPAVSHQDQAVWALTESFTVFTDSLRRLSARLEELKSNAEVHNTTPILSFDKDDVDTLDFVAASANLRSHMFAIETRSKFDIKQMAGNIIPAIATTNAMTAGLCVMQAFKVLKTEYDKARMVFLTVPQDRVISSERLSRPKGDCPVCSVARARVIIDSSRATLEDLVKSFLKMQFEYSEEISVGSEQGILFDPDFDDNLPKTLSELGVQGDTFLTIKDEDDENPRVDLVLSVSDKSLPEDIKPIHASEKVEIPRKPKQAPAVETNGANGHVLATTNGVTGKRKRDTEEVGFEEQLRKRGKVIEEPILVSREDVEDDGAIVIDD